MADLFTIAATVASGIFGAGVAWAALSAKVSTITTKLTEHEERLGKHGDSLHARELEEERIKARIGLLEQDANERVFGIDKLDAETRQQTGMLMEIQRRLGRVATPSSDMRSSVSEQQPRPAPLPPRRQRLRSSRGGAE